MEMYVWVMSDEAREFHAVAPGSAVVSCTVHGMEALCSIEGNLHGALNLVVFGDRVLSAATRLRTGYPTSAVRSIPRRHLLPVGAWDEDRGEILLQPGGLPRLTEWLGVPEEEAAQQIRTTASLRHEASRLLQDMESTSQGRMLAKWLRINGPTPYRNP